MRSVAPLLLSLHIVLKILIPRPTIPIDLILFNSIAFICAITITQIPQQGERVGRYCLAAAIGFWSMGSTVSTWNSFYSYQLPKSFIDISYSLFYPTALFALLRILAPRKSSQVLNNLDLLETAIFTLGSSSVLAAALLHFAERYFKGSTFSIYLSLLYPVGDLLLLTMSLTMTVINSRSPRTHIFTLGVALFTATDIYFLVDSAIGNYTFTSLTDDGWLLGIILITESLWHSEGAIDGRQKLGGWAAGLSLIASATLLLLSALHPNYFPGFVLIPAFVTISLAFLRLSLALRQSRIAAEDRELARTDELTGLANRRRFLSELELFRRKEGTLLLLDLNGFKLVNDRFGHHAGDRVLQIVADRFLRALPHRTILARLGGDEFGVIVYGPPEIGRDCAAALQAALSYSIRDGDMVVEIGVAIGIVPNDEVENSIEELMRRADSAMYRDKRSGVANYLPGGPTYRS